MQLNNKKIVKTALFAVLVGALGYSFAAKSETKLLPFQGKLTDANGQVIPDKAIVVQFKMYDAPVGGNAKWNGEVQMLSVNSGLVNTTLGTKASLKNVDFSTPTYLEITIDANGDNEIGPEDPPLLPRQSIIPAVYAVEAGNSKTMGGHDWSAVFSNGDPTTGKINGNKLADQSVDTKQIANNAVTSTQIKAEAVTTDKIAKGAVTSTLLADGAMGTGQIADGAITTVKLDEKAVTTAKIAEKSITTGLMANREMVDASETAAPIGSIARSKGTIGATGSNRWELGNDGVDPNYKLIPGMSVKLKTSGRPVMIMLQRGQINAYRYTQIHLRRNGETIFWTAISEPVREAGFPSSSILTCVDTPPAGEYEYSLYACKGFKDAIFYTWNDPYLIAFEL